ncbi:citrate synthase [Kyrpidia spormannii]|uniref:Citrate synthase II n=2 Tax=Kyrpidia spormannii TaxID=2055160 RepID=A0ACA8ZBC6_9BACL|nr:citrate synthase [Kyrpidia spormannii]CAB3393815.1 citrate synthase II [Kyrpidia spormannii]CAB3394739.1 citrate synthase II [Kyrpidia spormannii]HHY68564.1 citrate synthase [Alicyclobacillus sp.]
MGEQTFREGLEDVVVAESQICFIDGKKGRLIYRGYDIHDLATHSTFEEVVFLLWHGRLPKKSELDDLKAQLHRHQSLPEPVAKAMSSFPQSASPMEVLRTTVSLLSTYDAEAGEISRDANLRKAARLVAQLPTIVAAWEQLRHGRDPIAPRDDLSIAGNFLYMLFGEEPSPAHQRVFDTALILHADHELNASTFSARVTAATLSDLYSAITSAIGTLKGPLHGGANEQVMKMLLDIGEVDRAESWVKQALAEKKKIMGFGHRVYRTEDPRATHLRKMSEQMGKEAGDLKWYEISQAVERVVREEKGLYPNVDFYSASTYYSMGIPVDLFTPIFAVSRIAGWTAHVLEQYEHNRLIRPRAEYVGPQDLTYVPLDQR